jgi:hypothetical protein
LSKGLQTKIDEVVKEFSLDNNESALSRLVHRVTEAQRVISAEFSLDNDQSALSRMSKHLQSTSEAIDNNLTLDKETSALARLKRELMEILTRSTEANQKFQQEVTSALNEMRVRRQEAQRTPVHGKEFEQKVHDHIQADCQRADEVATFTGDTVGAIKNCKAGDTLIEMGPDHVAAGARIVVEAKDKKAYTFQQAREEIEQGRKNRAACVGLFVFAKSTAPEGLAPFQRIGDDLFVIWDADDPQTDIHLEAGLTVARALCTRQAKQRDASAADFVGIDKAINDIEKKAESLDAIRKAAETIQSGAETILDRVRIARDGIVKQVGSLRDLMTDLKTSLNDGV